MKIKTFDRFLNEEKLDSAELKVPAGWSVKNSWESNSGKEMNYILEDDTGTFRITIEWFSDASKYSVGFGELGDRNIVDAPQRYQVNFLTGARVNKAVADMAKFLRKYIVEHRANGAVKQNESASTKNLADKVAYAKRKIKEKMPSVKVVVAANDDNIEFFYRDGKNALEARITFHDNGLEVYTGEMYKDDVVKQDNKEFGADEFEKAVDTVIDFIDLTDFE